MVGNLLHTLQMRGDFVITTTGMRDQGPTGAESPYSCWHPPVSAPHSQFLPLYTDADVQLSPFPPFFPDHSTLVSYLHSCPTSIREMHPGIINPFATCYDL